MRLGILRFALATCCIGAAAFAERNAHLVADDIAALGAVRDGGLVAEVEWAAPVDGNWSDPTKWSTGAVPGIDDVVFIHQTGTYTVTADVDIRVASLSVGAAAGTQTLANTSRILTIDQHVDIGANGHYDHAGSASLRGSGRLTVNGSMQWTAGTIGGSLTLEIAEESELRIEGDSAKTINDLPTLDNRGTVAWTGGIVRLVSHSQFKLLNSGLFDLRGDLLLERASDRIGSVVFTNSGTLRKSAGEGEATLGTGVRLDNAGLVDVESGTLQVRDGGSTGRFVADVGTILRFHSGIHTLNVGATLEGEGRVEVGGGTLRTAAGGGRGTALADVPTLALGSSGRLDGDGTLRIARVMEWTAGTIGGALTLEIAEEGELRIEGTAAKTINDMPTLDNRGTVAWTGGIVRHVSQSQFKLLNSGLFDLRGDLLLERAAHWSGSVVFTNSGTLRKSVGEGTTTFGAGVRLDNAGMVEVAAGTLAFHNVNFAQQPTGRIWLNGGSLSSNQTVPLAAGALIGDGTVAASVNNSGAVVAPGSSAGRIIVTGAYTQGPGGTLAIELAGLEPGTEFDQLQVDGAANLGGTLEVSFIEPFAPSFGSEFRIVTFASAAGDFSTVAIPEVPHGQLTPERDATGITLRFLSPIPVVEGWNLLSSMAHMDTVTFIQAGAINSNPTFWAWDSARQAYLQTAHPEPGQGFWFHALAAGELRIFGRSPQEMPPPLSNGWNLVGPLESGPAAPGFGGVRALYGWKPERNGYQFQPADLKIWRAYWVCRNP